MGSQSEISDGRTFAWRRGLRRVGAFLPWTRAREHRVGRSGFLTETLGAHVTGRVLDVGAGRNAVILSRAFGDRYTPLDIGSSYHIDTQRDALVPDTLVDLEREGIALADRSFGTVLCTDVLEHLDNIYAIYDELFRVAREHVIISLPNNWVGYPISFLAGRNVTHRAGYGLPPEPKGVGERHKYFYNLEEAADFLVGRMPTGFRVERFEPRFEYGTDGILCGIRAFGSLVRAVEMGRFRELARREYGAKAPLVVLFGIPAYVILRPIDVILSALLWGFGRRARFYNLFCRQLWVVFRRIDNKTV